MAWGRARGGAVQLIDSPELSLGPGLAISVEYVCLVVLAGCVGLVMLVC